MITAGGRASGSAGGTAELTRFAAVDELSCYYEGPGEPNNVHLEVRVPGRLDERVLRDAVRAMLAAEPGARARRAARRPWHRGYAWEYPAQTDTDPVSRATWADETELGLRRASFLASSPPVDSSPPFRLLLAAGPGQDCVILNAHHAAFDGMSCLHVLRSIGRHYSGTPDPAAARAAFGLAPPPGRASAAVTPSARALPRAGGPAGTGSTLSLPAARIAACHEALRPGRNEPGYGYQLLALPRVPEMPSSGSGPHVTVNDLLITAMIMTIAQWNAAHGRSCRRVRITMPLSGRLADGESAVVGNLSQLAAVTARLPVPDGTDSELAAQVALQTRLAKSHAWPQADPLSRALLSARLPAGFKHRLLRAALRTLGPLVCDTTLISNLGSVADPPRFGSATPAQMWFSTPAHMPRGLSLGVVTVGGRMQLCFRYRRALFDEPAAARFTRAYIEGLAAVSSPGDELVKP
jgi:NRPS condensation-like uncharacterized protein